MSVCFQVTDDCGLHTTSRITDAPTTLWPGWMHGGQTLDHRVACHM